MISEMSSLSNDTVNIQHRSSNNINNTRTMDMRRDNRRTVDTSKQKYFQTLSAQNSPRRLMSASYFSLESMVVLVGLTASLLFLPLILPPLPPPPFMLLLVPIGIMVLLMVLALMPSSSSAKHVTSTYM